MAEHLSGLTVRDEGCPDQEPHQPHVWKRTRPEYGGGGARPIPGDPDNAWQSCAPCTETCHHPIHGFHPARSRHLRQADETDPAELHCAGREAHRGW